ncbi:MAG: hypothetical protein KZQ83_12710 [gamma proteobacterium symbiont of Taylorina sp.]|nr:hypothetical protein [gamma proteobacterium symbiont of Taylorina sp.]
MSLTGIWVFEVSGIYGWERISTVFLEKGRYLGGGAIMFSKGTYVRDGKKIKIEIDVTQHGEKQTIFGEKRKHFSTTMTGKKSGDTITGLARLKGSHSTTAEYHFRLNRLADIPKLPKAAKK